MQKADLSRFSVCDPYVTPFQTTAFTTVWYYWRHAHYAQTG